MKSKILPIILTIAASFAMNSCSGRAGKAQEAIQSYLKSTMHDPNSYESVEFGKLEGGPDIYSMTHKYREKSETGETVSKSETFSITKSGLHARLSRPGTEDLEWAIKWSLREDR